MRLVLDASVAVASMRATDPAHSAARGQIGRAIQNVDELVLPVMSKMSKMYKMSKMLH